MSYPTVQGDPGAETFWSQGQGLRRYFRARFLGEYPGTTLMYVLLVVAVFGFAWQVVEESIIGAALGGGLASTLHMTPLQTSWLLVAGTLALIPMYPLAGPAADKLGRKPVVVLGLTGFLVSDLIKAFAPGYGVFMVGRVLSGFMIMFTIVPTLAIVRDFTPRLRRGAGYGIITAFGWGLGALITFWLSSPVLGAFAHTPLFGMQGSWRWLYIVYAAAAAAAALIEGLFLKDLPLLLRTRRRGLDVASEEEAVAAERAERGSVLAAIRTYLTRPRMWIIYSNQWFWGICWFGVLTFFPLIVEQTEGLSAPKATFLSGFVWLAYLVSSFVLSWFLDLLHVRKPINIIGMLGVAATVIYFATQMMYTHSSFGSIAVIFVLIGIFAGAQYPSFAICLAGESERIDPNGVASSFAFYTMTSSLVAFVPQFFFPILGAQPGGWRIAVLIMGLGALASAPTLIAAHGPYKPRLRLPTEMEEAYY